MFFPLSTDHHDGRIGVVSLVIITLCIIVHLFVHGDNRRIERSLEQMTQGEESSGDSSDFYYYDLAEKILAAQNGNDVNESVEDITGEKPELSPYENRVDSLMQSRLLYRGGLMKSRLSLFTLFSHMFLHADWAHLLGNLWFFYLVGIMMERYWGPMKFLLIYLGVGLFSGLGFIVISDIQGHSMDTIPLVGASGAIAGMMGALFATARHMRVKIFYIIFFRPRITEISMGWYLGLYFIGQLLYGIFLSQFSPVAYMAHVAGFVLGALFGFLIPGEKFANHAEEDEQYFKATLTDLPEVAGGALPAGVAATGRTFADLPQVAGGGKPKTFADLPQVAGGEKPKTFADLPQVAGGEKPKTFADLPQVAGGETVSPANKPRTLADLPQVAGGAAPEPKTVHQPFTPKTQLNPTEEAWKAFSFNRFDLASSGLEKGIEHYLHDTVKHRADLEREIDRIYSSAKNLKIPAQSYYNWAINMAMHDLPKPALLCYELAAQFTNDNLPFRMKALLKSAELRVDHEVDTARAAKFLQFIIQSDTQGAFKNEAEYYLKKISL